HGSVVRMGKRTGNIITLLDLVEAIGVDAARYALVRNHIETNLDIDLDLWAKATSDNPVYYVQYAHARVSSILRNAADLGRDPGRARQRPRTPRGLGAGPDVSPTHEAGWAHVEGALRGPSWLRPPDDAQALVPSLWSSTARKVDGDLVVGGVSVPDLVANVNTPAYVLDEADLRARARAFREAF